MADNSKIEWCDSTWNPIQGCTPISAGCRNCYAKAITDRFKGTPGHPYEYGFKTRFFPERLTIPARWRKPRKVFVSSMGDLFHDAFTYDLLDRIFDVMVEHDRHTYFVLTKRPDKMKAYLVWLKGRHAGSSLSHIWFGVSVEDNATMHRIDTLTSIEGINRFVSFEPLLEVLTLNKNFKWHKKVHWMICGAETGPKARRMPFAAACGLHEFSRIFHIPFFFKKWGKHNEYVINMIRELPDFEAFRKGGKK